MAKQRELYTILGIDKIMEQLKTHTTINGYYYCDDDVDDLDKSTFKINFALAIANENYDKVKNIYENQILDKGSNSPEALGTKLALNQMSKRN